MLDPVNPTHYARLQPQPIEVIESWQLGPHAANVLKYLARAGHKDGTPELDDLRKAKWYLDRLLWLAEQAAPKSPPAEPAKVETGRGEPVPVEPAANGEFIHNCTAYSTPGSAMTMSEVARRVAQEVCRR